MSAVRLMSLDEFTECIFNVCILCHFASSYLPEMVFKDISPSAQCYGKHNNETDSLGWILNQEICF